MHNLIRSQLVLAFACSMAAAASWGQNATAATLNSPTLEVAVMYEPMFANVTTGGKVGFEGGSVQVHGQFWHGLGAVADVAGQHAGNLDYSGVGLDLITATFGPGYTWSRAHSRYSFFGQALVGEAFGTNSTFPTPSTTVSNAHSLATQVGGGVNFSLSPRLSFRAVEASWLRSQIPNATDQVQNSMRLGAGIVWQLH